MFFWYSFAVWLFFIFLLVLKKEKVSQVAFYTDQEVKGFAVYKLAFSRQKIGPFDGWNVNLYNLLVCAILLRGYSPFTYLLLKKKKEKKKLIFFSALFFFFTTIPT